MAIRPASLMTRASAARRDVYAAVEFLERRHPGRPVIVDGNSMGAAAAIFAAGDLGHRVAAYILESPYQDLKVAVWNRIDNWLPQGSVTPHTAV